ncbi:MAG TPA: alpha/beta-hydrolase family protein [Microthrixaceae bacterium]|nr:alpha/beta-hydrolase family protein [Microthrixaceae bacterium]
MSTSAWFGDTAVEVADRLNPIGGPAGPLKARALFAAFRPSLMPRAAWHQGAAAGVSLLAAYVVGGTVNGTIERVVPPTAHLGLRLGARGLVAGVGLGLQRLPESDDEPTAVASVRAAGRLAAAAAIGGVIHEGALAVRDTLPPKSAVRPVVMGAGGLAGALLYSRSLLRQREAVVEQWTKDDKPASLPVVAGVGLGVVAVGRGLGAAFRVSRASSVRFFGDDPAHAAVGRLTNAALWGAGLATLYSAGVGYIARTNEKVEPAYSAPPDHGYASGGPDSVSPFDELGLQGRRFVTDVVTPELIEQVLGEPAVAHPIRAYVGVNSEPIYATGRSEMMMDELERLGAFERSHLLLVSPTGTGWVDQTMIEAAEFLTRGDIATACIQYGRGPSFLEVQKVHLGRSQFRGLLWAVKMRLEGIPAERRPKVLVFGESLGAWSSSDVVMFQGISGFDHYGIDRALWFGLPGLAKWSKTGMRQGSSELVPPGTVGAFDRFGQYENLSEEERDRLRAVIVDHDNDPIAQVSFRWAVKCPPWLSGDDRGRGVPAGMDWVPLITFVQIAIDATNAMRVVPGQFKSFGHDYRGDTAEFVHAAYRLPTVSDEQMAAVVEALLRLEVERGERIKQARGQLDAGRTPAVARTKRPLWRTKRLAPDVNEPAIRRTPGRAPADIQ